MSKRLLKSAKSSKDLFGRSERYARVAPPQPGHFQTAAVRAVVGESMRKVHLHNATPAAPGSVLIITLLKESI